VTNLRSERIPSYRKHKATGQARVTLNGKTHYLGKYGSASSRLAYARLVPEWLAHDRRLPHEDTCLAVSELILTYWKSLKPWRHRVAVQRQAGRR
jgi:hypothetical protein